MWCPSEFFVTCSTWTSFFLILFKFFMYSKLVVYLNLKKKIIKIIIFVILEKEKCYIKERNLR